MATIGSTMGHRLAQRPSGHRQAIDPVVRRWILDCRDRSRHGHRRRRDAADQLRSLHHRVEADCRRIAAPLSDARLARRLRQIQAIPQYKLVNKGMSLDAFKTIFWWEWAHRFLGRFIGLAFIVPFGIFLWRGQLIPRLRNEAPRDPRARRPAGLHRLVHGDVRASSIAPGQPVSPRAPSVCGRRDLRRALMGRRPTCCAREDQSVHCRQFLVRKLGLLPASHCWCSCRSRSAHSSLDYAPACRTTPGR